ncbi:MAG: glycoside hydrolase family 43 protein [Lachnospiraceae bacterium]|nr:glycoside hydrolase family 43 protein [Lachnospiraceae bacterium]
MYTNPVITGFAADPSICKGADGYYLVTSTFTYFPGISVFFSQDLLSWKQVGNAIPTPEDIDFAGEDVNGGIWAPTIRYYEGEYYVCAAVEKKGNLITHTKDPAGTWAKPVWVEIGGIDPSLFFENGKAYFCTNDWSDGMPGIRLGVVDPKTGETLEHFSCIYRGNGGGWLEAPHIYHIGEYYYLLAAEGGTYSGHMEIAARSRNLYGPYESCPLNPILTNRADTSKAISCTGHGDLIQAESGQYYMVHLGCRPGALAISSLGRETFLSPIKWENGWPVVPGGMATLQNDDPCLSDADQKKTVLLDDFTQDAWPVFWKFRGNSCNNMKRGNGALTISLSKRETKAFAYVRQPDLFFTCRVVLDTGKLSLTEGAFIGLTLYLSDSFYVLWGIRVKEGQCRLVLEQQADDLKICHEDVMWDAQGPVRLRIIGEDRKYRFGAERAALPLQEKTLSARFLSPSVMDRGFTGTMVGVGILGEEYDSGSFCCMEIG